MASESQDRELQKTQCDDQDSKILRIVPSKTLFVCCDQMKPRREFLDVYNWSSRHTLLQVEASVPLVIDDRFDPEGEWVVLKPGKEILVEVSLSEKFVAEMKEKPTAEWIGKEMEILVYGFEGYHRGYEVYEPKEGDSGEKWVVKVKLVDKAGYEEGEKEVEAERIEFQKELKKKRKEEEELQEQRMKEKLGESLYEEMKFEEEQLAREKKAYRDEQRQKMMQQKDQKKDVKKDPEFQIQKKDQKKDAEKDPKMTSEVQKIPKAPEAPVIQKKAVTIQKEPKIQQASESKPKVDDVKKEKKTKKKGCCALL